MIKKPKYPFKSMLSKFAKSREFDAADRDHLSRWSDDDRAEEVWSEISDGIRKTQGIEPSHYAHFFIQEVLSLRGFVRNPNVRPAYLERALDAERVARFLNGSVGLPPPFPQFPNYEGLAASLNELSKMLRDQAARSGNVGLVRSSRKSKSLARSDFSRLVSDLLKSLCGQPLDIETAALTQIAFDEKKTDTDFVRNARRPRANRTKAILP
jgi:hypothetical protein